MKRVTILIPLCLSALLLFACSNSAAKQTAQGNTPQASTRQSNQENDQSTPTGGNVIVMNKAMFINQVCDYEKDDKWNYRGTLPAIIDLYADWCGPCRMTSPIMEELAKEYAGQIVIYKVNVDKERELAALFGASSIPLFVFIPTDDQPQLFRGAADKATYKRIIDEFLLKKKS